MERLRTRPAWGNGIPTLPPDNGAFGISFSIFQGKLTLGIWFPAAPGQRPRRRRRARWGVRRSEAWVPRQLLTSHPPTTGNLSLGCPLGGVFTGQPSGCPLSLVSCLLEQRMSSFARSHTVKSVARTRGWFPPLSHGNGAFARTGLRPCTRGTRLARRPTHGVQPADVPLAVSAAASRRTTRREASADSPRCL